MYQSISQFSQFREAFVQMNRDKQFSHEGFRSLFDYFEEYENFTSCRTALTSCPPSFAISTEAANSDLRLIRSTEA